MPAKGVGDTVMGKTSMTREEKGHLFVLSLNNLGSKLYRVDKT